MEMLQQEHLERMDQELFVNELNIDVEDKDIERLIEPYVTEKFCADDPVWLKLVEDNAKQQRRRRLRRQLLGWISKFRRTQRGIQAAYSLMWADVSFDEQLERESGSALYVWRGQGMRARTIGYKRVHLLFFIQLLKRLRPVSVLEVGCGNGLNLLVLSSCFPDIKFSGVELTAGGVRALAATRVRGSLPPSIEAFSPVPVSDTHACQRIAAVQGNAAALPFSDRSFDLVITSLALEQMEEVRTKALLEIARVARVHTAMLEPFHEWNEAGSRRDYIFANDYFTGRIADLHLLGLEPMYVRADMPAKLTFQPGIVVCRQKKGTS
jgi:SAM-dependent methyltransferase